MFKCPICGADAYVLNNVSKYVEDDKYIVKRYRVCAKNKYHRVTTIEITEDEYKALKELEGKNNG